MPLLYIKHISGRIMRSLRVLCIIATTAMSTLVADADPVVSTRPRILLTPAVKSLLLDRVRNGDPRWLRLKAVADELKTRAILPYKWATRTTRRENTIYYDYQGEGWYSAAMPLALAYQMTGDVSYSNKLMELIDEMVRAQSDPDNTPPTGFGPLVPDNYYSTRNLGPVLGVVYDWCYDQLGARKSAIVALMNLYYNELRDSASITLMATISSGICSALR